MFLPDRDGFSQTCEDLDGDGICDSAYQIEGADYDGDAGADADVDELPLVYSPPVNSLMQNKAIMSESIEEENEQTGANVEKEEAEKAPLGVVYSVGILLIAFLISSRRRNEWEYDLNAFMEKHISIFEYLNVSPFSFFSGSFLEDFPGGLFRIACPK